jgi:ParB/RepB/Spo0J family partition protein
MVEIHSRNPGLIANMLENLEFKLVPVGKIHPSLVLPSREYGPEVAASIERIGIQQPPIVRPLVGKSDEYEIIDGRGRFLSLKNDQKVLVDIRHDIKDSDVFRISEATFQRKDRSAYEKACFYDKWLKMLQKEKGECDGLQIHFAKQANLSESAISQYLAICNAFEKLKSLSPNEEFNALKSWSVNKLYALSEIDEDPDFLETARELEKKGDISIEEMQHFLTERNFKQMEEILASPDEGNEKLSESKTDSASVSLSAETGMQLTSYKNCLKYAQKVGKLETETHQTLSALVQKMFSDTEKFSSSEILGILTSLLQTLKKLKKQTAALHEKIQPQN